MINKYQLEYKLDTHEENTVRFTTSIESLTNQISRMQTTIETMSETIKENSEENRRIVRAYNEIIKERKNEDEAIAEKFIKTEFGKSVDH